MWMAIHELIDKNELLSMENQNLSLENEKIIEKLQTLNENQ